MSDTGDLLDPLRDGLSGFEDEDTSDFVVLSNLIRGRETLAPYLPLLLSLKGQPYSIEDYFPFEPFFRTVLPQRLLVKSGRQVAKTSTLAAQNVLRCWTTPYRSILCVSPLYETTRRFSHNYVRPLIEKSPWRRLFCGRRSINSVLQRSFANGATMHFSFAFLDAERTRGIPATDNVIDESVRIGTMVETPTGTKPVETFRPGDRVLSFDAEGCLREDEVIDCSDHGVRDCYRFEFSNGDILEATSDSWLATTAGWKRVEAVIADSCAGTTGTGHHAGRRLYDRTRTEPHLSQPSRLVAIRLQLPKVPGVIRVRGYDAHEAEEQRLRGMVQSLADVIPTGALAYRFLVSPQQQEAGDARLASASRRPTSSARGCLRKLWTTVRDDRSSQGSLLRTRMQEESRGPLQTGLRLQEAELVRVTWTGKHRVFDLETRHYNTFIAGGVAVHNCQNIHRDFLPIIHETLSGAQEPQIQYAGTPKSLDNTMEDLWQDSSQAEWVIRCRRGGCNHWNIPALSHDLYDMIGPYRDDISEEEPGIVCAKCRRPLAPRSGYWLHAEKERRLDFAGYHVPQIIMPMHYRDPEKWSTLLGKMAGRGNTTPTMFLNEVCGESSDVGSKLVTVTDLKAAACLPWPNVATEAVRHLSEYSFRLLAVDWGGGGGRLSSTPAKGGETEKRLRTSYTTLAVLGFRPNGQIDVLWGHRSLRTHAHVYEAQLCLDVLRQFRCRWFVHDYGGAGAVRETLMVNAGVPVKNIIPMAYHRPTSGGMVDLVMGTDDHPRTYYSVDRSWSLATTCQCVKSGKVRFFAYDHKSSDEPGLLHDFLALIEEKIDRPLGTDVYQIARNPNMPDDFAQAVNLGCCAIWYATKKFPDIAAAERLRVPADLLSQLTPSLPDLELY